MKNHSHDDIKKLLIPLEQLAQDRDSTGLASVLVPIIDSPQPRLLLTLRSAHLRHHAGEVAFPGGMWEPGDIFPADTALRESLEEVELPPANVKLLGGLDMVFTRRLTQVRPVVGVIPPDLPLVANENEIAAIFSVPLDFFYEDSRIRTDIFTKSSHGQVKQYWVPAYQFGDYEIWGFTAAVITQFMNRCLGANLSRENHAPERVW